MQLAKPATNFTALQPGNTTWPLLVLTTNVTVPVWALPVTDAMRITGAPYAATVEVEASVIGTLIGVNVTGADGKPGPALLVALTVHV